MYLTFSVHDTGSGLTDEERALLFQRFTQASPETHVNYGGSGLGLFICRKLTELQGGQITVQSRHGEGSIFSFYIEVQRAQSPSPIFTQDAISEAAAELTNARTEASLQRGFLERKAVKDDLAKHSRAVSAVERDNYHILIVEAPPPLKKPILMSG